MDVLTVLESWVIKVPISTWSFKWRSARLWLSLEYKIKTGGNEGLEKWEGTLVKSALWSTSGPFPGNWSMLLLVLLVFMCSQSVLSSAGLSLVHDVWPKPVCAVLLPLHLRVVHDLQQRGWHRLYGSLSAAGSRSCHDRTGCWDSPRFARFLNTSEFQSAL